MAILPPEGVDELRGFADRLVDNGWPVAPIVAGEKACRAKAWQKRRFESDEFVRRLLKDGHAPSVGLRLHGLAMIDVDADDAATARKIRKLAEATIGETNLVRVGRAPRVALFYRTADAKFSLAGWKPTGAPVEIRTRRNHMAVAFGRHPDTGRPYAWESDSPLDVLFDSVPIATAEGLRAFRAAAEQLFGLAGVSDQLETKSQPAASQRRGQGKAIDNRSALLRDVVCAALGRARVTGRPINRANVEAEAWDAFATAANISVRKGNGRGYWTRADVARVVAYSMRPERLSRISPVKPERTWTADTCRVFLSLIRRDPRCSASASEVARVMLAAVNPGRDPREVCCQSSESIGDAAGVSPKVARAMRRRLIELGYFLETERGFRRSPKGRPGKATVVRPNPAWLEGVVFTEGSVDPTGVVVPFQNGRNASLSESVQVVAPYTEISRPAPPKVQNPITIQSPPCDASQPDLFDGETPIGGDHAEFGAWLRQERKRLGLSQAALGALIGLRQPHMANVERGHDGLAPERRRQLWEALKGAENAA